MNYVETQDLVRDNNGPPTEPKTWIKDDRAAFRASRILITIRYGFTNWWERCRTTKRSSWSTVQGWSMSKNTAPFNELNFEDFFSALFFLTGGL